MRNSGIPLSSFPPKVQEQIVAQLHPKKTGSFTTTGAATHAGPVNLGGAIFVGAPEKDRLRQNKKGPNKTEAAFALHLRETQPGREINEQGITLLLANGLRYTPDIFLPPILNGKVESITPLAYEVKGFMRDDAAGKIKMAAKIHPWITFYLVTRRKKASGGGWQIQEILK